MDRTEPLIASWRAEGIETVYPLVFRFGTSVPGEGWVAGVELRGAAVVTKETSGEYIAHGLKPGGVAGVGSTLIEAYESYKEDVLVVLGDLAGSGSFESFREKVLEFFDSADAWGEAKFRQGRQMVAAGKVDFSLPREPRPALDVRVVELERYPKSNPVLPAGESHYAIGAGASGCIWTPSQHVQLAA